MIIFEGGNLDITKRSFFGYVTVLAEDGNEDANRLYTLLEELMLKILRDPRNIDIQLNKMESL